MPRLDFGAKYDLNGARGYVRGVWASSLAYRPSNRTFYWLGQIDFAKMYVHTATAAEGPWSRHATIDTPYYDAGLRVDTDDTLYVAYGNTTINVAQLSPDGRNQVRTQQVFTTPSSVGTLEGSRFYKINGHYYIFLTRPANGQYILKSSGPFGPYTMRQVLLDLRGPIPGGGVPRQDGLVQTRNGVSQSQMRTIGAPSCWWASFSRSRYSVQVKLRLPPRLWSTCRLGLKIRRERSPRLVTGHGGNGEPALGTSSHPDDGSVSAPGPGARRGRRHRESRLRLRSRPRP